MNSLKRLQVEMDGKTFETELTSCTDGFVLGVKILIFGSDGGFVDAVDFSAMQAWHSLDFCKLVFVERCEVIVMEANLHCKETAEKEEKILSMLSHPGISVVQISYTLNVSVDLVNKIKNQGAK